MLGICLTTELQDLNINVSSLYSSSQLVSQNKAKVSAVYLLKD